MNCSKLVRKVSSIKTLREVSEFSGFSIKELQVLYKTDHTRFVCILCGVIAETQSLVNYDYIKHEIKKGDQ